MQTKNTNINDLDKKAERLKQAREILKESAVGLSDEELEVIVVQVQSLAVSWLDDFERKTFDGKTLAELLSERE